MCTAPSAKWHPHLTLNKAVQGLWKIINTLNLICLLYVHLFWDLLLLSLGPHPHLGWRSRKEKGKGGNIFLSMRPLEKGGGDVQMRQNALSASSDDRVAHCKVLSVASPFLS